MPWSMTDSLGPHWEKTGHKDWGFLKLRGDQGHQGKANRWTGTGRGMLIGWLSRILARGPNTAIMCVHCEAVNRSLSDQVSCLAWNPKNRDVLATGSNDGTARLWDFHSSSDGHALSLGKKPSVINHKSIDSSKKNVTAVCWHPDGTILATGAFGHSVSADNFSFPGRGREAFHSIWPITRHHVLRQWCHQCTEVLPVWVSHSDSQKRLHCLLVDRQKC